MKLLYVHVFMFLWGPDGRLALPNELPSQNKDITYLLTRGWKYA